MRLSILGDTRVANKLTIPARKKFEAPKHALIAGAVAAAFVLWPSHALGSSPSPPDQVPMTIKVLGCKQDATKTPSINLDFRDAQLKPESSFGNVFVFKLSAAPGLHRFFLSTPTCDAQFHTVVLEQHPRYITVRLDPYVLLAEEHSGCALAGLLPFDGLTVKLLLAKGSYYEDLTVPLHLTSPVDISIPATIDHGAYYVDDLFPGEYKLEVGFRGKTSEIPVTLSTKNGPKCQAFERDITAKDLLPESGASSTHRRSSILRTAL